jgi:Mn-dependent transcriptional regulator
MNSLVKAGWVEYTPYKGSMLSDAGAEYAKKLIRKHRLWEVFLVDNLGFNIDEVHNEAEVLEHSTSDILADQLEKYLGYPEHCPHGGAIPLELMDTQEKVSTRLSDIKNDDIVSISRILNEDKLVQHFKRANLNINDDIQITDRDKKLDLFYITNHTSGEDTALSRTIAQYLFVVDKTE